MTKRFFLSIVFILASYLVKSQNNTQFIQLSKPFDNFKYHMEQDSLGVFWFYNNNEIYKYDGEHFFLKSITEVFGKHIPKGGILKTFRDNNKNIWLSLSTGTLVKINEVKPLNIDSTKNKNINTFTTNKSEVWMGSTDGYIYKHDNTKNKLHNITRLPLLNNYPQQIDKIGFTSKDSLWISTHEDKLYNYSITDSTLTPLVEVNKLLPSDITIDKNKNLWIATELKGLYIFNNKTKSAQPFSKAGYFSEDTDYPFFIKLYNDKQNNIWACTDGDGLFKIDAKTKSVKHYKHDRNNPFSLNNNTIIDIYNDINNNIWVIGKKGEISILPNETRNKNIKYYSGSLDNHPTTILSVLKASDGSLWMGTDGEGINRVLPNKRKVQYNEKTTGKNNFKGKYIMALLEDNKGNIWITTYQNGLWVYNITSETFSQIEVNNSNKKYTTNIAVLFKDSKNRIWTSFTGANNSPNRVYVFSDNQELLASFNYDQHGLTGTTINSITEDKNNTIWFGVTKGGLYQFNENTTALNKSTFKKQEFIYKKEDFFRNNNISSLTSNYNGSLFIITRSGFFVKYNIAKKEFKLFYESTPFKNIRPNSIILEDTSNIWFGSRKGIYHYNTTSKQLTSYSKADGFLDDKYSAKSVFKDRYNTLYFGCDYGVYAFNPNQINKIDAKAKLLITDIHILNKPIQTIIPNQLKTRIENLKKIDLKYNQASFSFSFSAISNTLNTEYNYVYRLKGFENEWIKPSQKGATATYTNIPHGDYIFQVKASSDSSNWDVPLKSINIKITPPWWLSNLAFAIYIITTILLIYGFYIWVKLKNKLHTEELKYNSEKELYALKMNFFAKMSHEIQTPLTLILGPINDMLKRAVSTKNDLLRQRLLMIQNNAGRLSRIAMELTTLRNKELGKLRVYASKNNLINDLKRISDSFIEQAKFKNISFTQEYPSTEINLWYDFDKIEHIFYNLLSNAYKFTPVNGNITLKVSEIPEKEEIEISLSDTGPGIPQTEIDSIFNFLYQSELGKNVKGTGIGLALVKELIELHYGKIVVSSSPESGTCFTITLSTKEDLFSVEEQGLIEGSRELSNEEIDDSTLLNLEKNNPKEKQQKLYTILIVEDNIDMQIFLQDIFTDTYELLIADNGEEGLRLAIEKTPDLIISDVMMPKIDGVEMIKLLKENKQTTHIPIIMLTAKNSVSGKINALKTGAVEYLRKPFNIYELTLKVNNILSAKETTLNKYKTDQLSFPKDDETIKSRNTIFLENLTEELNKQILNPDFKLEHLTETMNMSYSAIYRTYFEITGKTPVDLVKKLKLNKAASLIIENDYNISEAAYMVGYKDPRYFSKSFKEVFGKTPTALKKEAKKESIEYIIKKYNFKA